MGKIKNNNGEKTWQENISCETDLNYKSYLVSQPVFISNNSTITHKSPGQWLNHV